MHIEQCLHILTFCSVPSYRTDIRQFGFGPKLPDDWVPPGANLTRSRASLTRSQDAIGANTQRNTQVTTQQLADGTQVTRTTTQVIQPPKPLPIGEQMPVPRGFDAVGQKYTSETQSLSIFFLWEALMLVL